MFVIQEWSREGAREGARCRCRFKNKNRSGSRSKSRVILGHSGVECGEKEQQQKNWVCAIPRVWFAIMNTVNSSMGYTPFQLKSTHSPRLIPPITMDTGANGSQEVVGAREVIERLQKDVLDAQDNLMAAKTRQAHFANAHQAPEDAYQVGDLVMLSTKN